MTTYCCIAPILRNWHESYDKLLVGTILSVLSDTCTEILVDGEYCGDIGDLVLPALVNTLSLPITVFTSAENMPVLMLLPISSIPSDSHPLFNDESQSRVKKCTCGRSSSKGVSCAVPLYIAPNAPVSMPSSPAVRSVGVKIHMDKDQMLTSYVHIVFARENGTGMTHRIILSGAEKQRNSWMIFLMKRPQGV